MENATRKIFKAQHNVRNLIKNKPELADDNKRLCAYFWVAQLRYFGYKFKSLTAEQFLVHYTKGTLTDSETICRASRKVQEKYPELRGVGWKVRKNISEKVGQEINRI